MLINYDSNFEKRKADFEKGILSTCDLTQEEIEKLTLIYKTQIDSNRKEIAETKYKIKQIKKKIDNMV